MLCVKSKLEIIVFFEAFGELQWTTFCSVRFTEGELLNQIYFRLVFVKCSR